MTLINCGLKMKCVLIFMLAVTLAYAKKEFKYENCDAKALIKILNAEDINPRGPITPHLKLKGTIASYKDIAEKEHYDIYVDISLKIYAIFGYVPIPSFVYDKIGKAVETKGELEYLGNGKIRVHCLFKRIFGQCIPPKGEHTQEIDLSYLLDKGLEPVRILVPSTGWYKIGVVGKTKDGQHAFCLNFEVNLRK